MTFLAAKSQLPLVSTLILTSLTPTITHAQTASLPPARSYHIDQYGRETKVVKERYSNDSHGEKQGIYLLYDTKGQPITKYTYVHGVKSGPAFTVGDDYFYSISWRQTIKSIGSYLNGKEQGWWDIYSVGGNGETGALDRRMKYTNGVLEYATTYREGKLYATYKYVGNVKNGPVKLYGASDAQYATGEYANNVPVGIWHDAGVKVEKGNSLTGGTYLSTIYRKGGSLTYAQGKLVTITEPGGKARPAEDVLQQYAASQKSAMPLPVAQTTFYNFASGEQAKFEAMGYYMPGSTNGIKGAELMKSDVLKTAEIAKYIEANPDTRLVTLLLKAAKSQGANPAQLLMSNLSLTANQFNTLIYINSPQLDGELMYYGLRGTEAAEKGHGSNLMVMRLIKARRDESDSYKSALEASFYRCAKAAKDTYSDTNKYPLRRWLYDEYQNEDPLKWMNMITKSDTQNDQKNFPKLFGN